MHLSREPGYFFTPSINFQFLPQEFTGSSSRLRALNRQRCQEHYTINVSGAQPRFVRSPLFVIAAVGVPRFYRNQAFCQKSKVAAFWAHCLDSIPGCPVLPKPSSLGSLPSSTLVLIAGNLDLFKREERIYVETSRTAAGEPMKSDRL